MIAIGSDHGGFSMKEQLKPFIADMGYTIKDMGTTSEEACDYPDYAFAVAKLVSSGDADRGIMIDAVGVASAMVANKLPGVRAAACQNEFAARSSREHNDANLLTLGGRIIGIELAKTIVKAWLVTEFAGGRHQKRVDKISDIDLKYRKG
ncbi:MAG: ribose 5-phosphate isomerase B [Bacteroidota bacterium]|nr:ribose 5-phosphate isomerase B [Bacteroidota bacterium]